MPVAFFGANPLTRVSSNTASRPDVVSSLAAVFTGCHCMLWRAGGEAAAAQPNRGPWFAAGPPTGAPGVSGCERIQTNPAREKVLSASGDSLWKGAPE